MAIFRFKQFEVRNEKSAMKVNTDGVMLGAIARIEKDDRMVLDVGTGTGTIALMLAQRLEEIGNTSYQIVGIDIDKDSAEEASINFSNSKWAARLSGINCSLQDYKTQFQDKNEDFELVVSNPPYFEESLLSPDMRKTQARHSASLSYREIIDFCKDNLSKNGRLYMILPAIQENDICRYSREHGLYPQRIVSIQSTARKSAFRIIIEISRNHLPNENVLRENLIIHNKNNYDKNYLGLMGPFLNLPIC